MTSDPRETNFDEIPKAPPAAPRGAYISVSRGYSMWCLGMMAWSVSCVTYFFLTPQTLSPFIALTLGAMVIVTIVLPILLFDGEMWHKRLGWLTVLLAMFSLTFVGMMIMFTNGVIHRIRQDRYGHRPYPNDILHLILAVLTLGLTVWTILTALRASRLVKKLGRGDYPG